MRDIRCADGTSGQCREQKAAGIDAMVYIYRLKCPSSSLPSTISLSRLSSRSLFSPTICLSPWLDDGRNGKSEPSIPFDLTVVIFFRILSLFVEVPSSLRPVGIKKRNVRPSARSFPCDCIHEIAIYEYLLCC